jgi:hypothetical protein
LPVTLNDLVVPVDAASPIPVISLAVSVARNTCSATAL